MKDLVVDIAWNQRTLRSKLICITAVIWSTYTLAYLCNFFFYCGLVIYPLTHRAISSGLICILVFLLSPPLKKMQSDLLKWYDIIPLLVIISGCAYIAINANSLIAEGRLITYPYEMVLAILLFRSSRQPAVPPAGY